MKVEDVIQELGLKECAETRIGDETVRWINIKCWLIIS